MSRVEKTAHDERTVLEALDEIERAVKDMRKKSRRGRTRNEPSGSYSLAEDGNGKDKV